MLNIDIDVLGNLARVRERIADAAVRAGRDPAEITLIAVSKTHGADEVARIVRAGVRHIGENRVQEAAAKFPRVLELVDRPVFHMVGHLQTNKARNAVELFDWIDSVDSLKLAQALGRRVPDGQELPVLIEVYVGDDAERPGVRPDQLVDVVGTISLVKRVSIQGLMTIAPLGAESRAAFAQVRQLKESLCAAFPALHFGVLSMGMSEDFVEAIAEGSTEVRIGTALFGPRNPRF